MKASDVESRIMDLESFIARMSPHFPRLCAAMQAEADEHRANFGKPNKPKETK